MPTNAKRGPYIAGNRTPADWNAFKLDLQAGKASWKQAFEDYFFARLEARYLEPIERLRKSEKYAGEGFMIVAIQCTLIEFLAATYGGLKYRHGKAQGKYEYSKSGKLFIGFLKDRAPFSTVFTEQIAADFYASVRCGLLHEARTKDDWRIRASGPAVIDAANKIVYRNNLQTAILSFAASYGKALESDAELQRAFIRKFDDLTS